MCLYILHNKLGLKGFHFRWVPMPYRSIKRAKECDIRSSSPSDGPEGTEGDRLPMNYPRDGRRFSSIISVTRSERRVISFLTHQAEN
jgi:hypothetical protein